MRKWLPVLTFVVALGLTFHAAAVKYPTVRIAHGWEIISLYLWSPCFLSYNRSNDDRQYSDWASDIQYLKGDDGRLTQVRRVFRQATGEVITCKTEDEWYALRAAKGATRPRLPGPPCSG